MTIRPDIPETTAAEHAWTQWAFTDPADTGGRCDCEHEGLGVDWHDTTCPGASYALRRKAMELFDRVAGLEASERDLSTELGEVRRRLAELETENKELQVSVHVSDQALEWLRLDAEAAPKRWGDKTVGEVYTDLRSWWRGVRGRDH